MDPVGSIPMRSRHHPRAYTLAVLALLSLAAVAVAQDPAPPAGAPSAGPAIVVRLEGQLEDSWASILRRAEEAGARTGAVGLVIELDTPGGSVELMKRLGDRLDAIGAGRPTVCLVDSRALSAGAYLAMSCQQLWMVPAATLGSAAPVMIGPGGLPLPVEPGLHEKNLSALRAEFRARAERTGRDPFLAQAFVDDRIELMRVSVRGEVRIVDREGYEALVRQGEQPSFLDTICAAGELLALTTQEAVELGFCDGVAADRTALLAALGWDQAAPRELGFTWSEDLASAIGSWSWLLLLAAAFFVVVAFHMPGLGAPELAAVACVALFLFHGYLTGLAEWTEILLVVTGLALVAVEIFLFPGTLVAGIAGGALLLAGLLFAMQEFVLPGDSIDAAVLRANLLKLLVLVVVVPLAGMSLMRRLTRSRAGAFLSSTPSADFGGSVAGGGAAAVVPRTGATGRCLTPLRPAGRVEVEGEPYDALSQGDYLPAGRRVRVLGRQGISLLVAPLDEDPA